MASIAHVDFPGSVAYTFGAPRFSGQLVIGELVKRESQGQGALYRLFNAKDVVSYIPRLNGYTPHVNTYEISSGLPLLPNKTPFVFPHSLSIEHHGRDEYYLSLHRGLARDTTLLFTPMQKSVDFDIFLQGKMVNSTAAGKRKR